MPLFGRKEDLHRRLVVVDFLFFLLHTPGTFSTRTFSFGFYLAIPTALRTVFLHHILNMPNTPRVMTKARQQIQPQEHYIMVERLTSMHKDERHNQGWSRYRHTVAATSSTHIRLLFLHTTLTRPRIHAITTTIPSSTATCLNSHDDTRSLTFHHPHSPYHAKPTCY